MEENCGWGSIRSTNSRCLKSRHATGYCRNDAAAECRGLVCECHGMGVTGQVSARIRLRRRRRCPSLRVARPSYFPTPIVRVCPAVHHTEPVNPRQEKSAMSKPPFWFAWAADIPTGAFCYSHWGGNFPAIFRQPRHLTELSAPANARKRVPPAN